MPRYKITLEYDGMPYVGFQRQEGLHSVQGALETALWAFTGTQLEVFVAGRTDAGVHAKGQVIHVDLPRAYPPFVIRNAINAHLQKMRDTPEAISILEVAEVPETFHARFSAIQRVYQYIIDDRPAPLALDRARAWQVYKPLDAEALQRAADYLRGTHDFTAFRASACQARNPLKTLDVARVTRVGTKIFFDFEARSFLHHQVRNMVGTLKMVGEGKWSPEDVRDILKTGDRRLAGETAPPYGLYLVKVVYPEVE